MRPCSKVVYAKAAVSAAATEAASPREQNDDISFPISQPPGVRKSGESPKPSNGKLVFAPEDLTAEPGVHSHIDRLSPAVPEDVFRCGSCTEAECQVWD